MKKDLGSQPALYPMPVVEVAAYDENGTVSVMTVAWAQICDMDKIALFVDDEHKTSQNIRKTRAFTVSLADRAHMVEADYFGLATGNKTPDKFERSGCHAVMSAHVNAPIIEEFPVCLECELIEIVDTENVFALIGRIVNVSAEESLLNEKGKVDPEKLDVLIFDQFSGSYFVPGEKVGKAWNAGAPLLKKAKG